MREKRSVKDYLLERYCDLPPVVRDKTDGIVRGGIKAGKKLRGLYNPKLGKDWVDGSKKKLKKTFKI